MSHYKKLCKECDTIIDQCRCMFGDKEIRYGTCNDCKCNKSEAISLANEYKDTK